MSKTIDDVVQAARDSNRPVCLIRRDGARESKWWRCWGPKYILNEKKERIISTEDINLHTAKAMISRGLLVWQKESLTGLDCNTSPWRVLGKHYFVYYGVPVVDEKPKMTVRAIRAKVLQVIRPFVREIEKENPRPRTLNLAKPWGVAFVVEEEHGLPKRVLLTVHSCPKHFVKTEKEYQSTVMESLDPWTDSGLTFLTTMVQSLAKAVDVPVDVTFSLELWDNLKLV